MNEQTLPALSQSTVLDAEITVPEGLTVEERIRYRLHIFQTLRRRTVEQAWHCGKDLAEIKAGMEHGEWLPWLKREDIPKRLAQRFMELASFEMRQIVAFESVDAALKALKGPVEPVVDDGPDVQPPDPGLSKEDKLQAENDSLRIEIGQLRTQVEDLTDELEHYKNVQTGYDLAAEGAEDGGLSKSFEQVNRLIEERRVLTVRVIEQQHLRQEAERENRRLRKWLKSLGQDIKA